MAVMVLVFSPYPSDGNITVQNLTASWAMDVVDKLTLKIITFALNKVRNIMSVCIINNFT